MPKIGELYQTGNWKEEKHVPVIEAPDSVSADEMFDVKVSIGKEVAHPNTPEHHIAWIQLYFHPEGEKFAYEVGDYKFMAHGATTADTDKGPVYTNHSVVTTMKVNKPGTLIATSWCNIHGLWEFDKSLSLK